MLARYQNGCLQKTTRKDGAERWQFRWLEKFADGLSRQRKKTIGLVKDYPEHSKKLQVWLIKTERHPAFGVGRFLAFCLHCGALDRVIFDVLPSCGIVRAI